MRIIILLFLASLITFTVSGQIRNTEYGNPIVALIETDPWLWVMESDVPTIALYDSGHIIFKKGDKTDSIYYTVRLDSSEMQALVFELGLTDSLLEMPNYTKASTYTDQPDNILILNFEKFYMKKVYGNLRSMKSGARDKTLNAFIRVYDKLIHYSNSSATEWVPEYVEIMIQKTKSKKEAFHWPDDWPDLNSKTTLKRIRGQYSIYLEYAKFVALTKQLNSSKQGHLIEIDGKRFFAFYRFPFPNMN
jgi:hypothetical protein